MEKIERFQAVKAILARYIQENRMRNTPERLAILEMFYLRDELLNAQEVFDEMVIRFRVSRATVYNTIQLFYTLGLVIRVEEDNQIKYKACFGERDFFRTVCTRCGRVQKFIAPALLNAFDGVRYKRFHLEQIVASVYGICSSCQSKATRARKKREKEDEIKVQNKLKKINI
jgi:Fur family ferric uptake transcriptional regulator